MTTIKPAAVLLAALLLTACAESPGVGGQLDPYAANGTAVAISALATGTAVSDNSTRAAAEYAANANGTATAVQVTATAAAIGTAKAQITNAEAIAILEASQLEQEAARPGMTATAAKLQLLATQDAERAARQAGTAVFWAWARWAGLVVVFVGSLAGIAVGAYFAYYRTLYEDTAVKDNNGKVYAVRSDYRTLPPPTIIEQRLVQPTPRSQPLFVENANGGASRAGSLAAPDTDERYNINRWLVAVADGAEFNRTSAGLYRIGSERADMLIKTAIRQGYAVKGEGQTSPVIPAANFEDFINQFINTTPPPRSSMPISPSPA